jgi:cytochrome P450
MLLSPKLAVAPYIAAYEEMARRHPDYAFANLLFAFKYIPLCLNGDEHKVARRKIAEYMIARKAAVSAATPGIVDRWFGAIAAREQIELMTEVIQPLVKEVLGTLNQIDEDSRDLIRSASAVFDRMMGAKKRRELDHELAKIRAAIKRGRGSSLSEDEEGFSLALIILGNDTLCGTLAESLHQVFVASDGHLLNEIEYPATPTATGVPFVERIVTEPFECEGITLQRGDRIRILFQSFQYTDKVADRTRFFGAGIHTCLGRQLSLEIWSLVTRALSKMNVRVALLDYVLRDSDYVFAYPSRFLIELKV